MSNLFLGHLVGDYLFQCDWMAINKSKYNGLGWLTCLVHCILYTSAVCLIMWTFNVYWIVLIFVSHFLIDKFGIAEKYLKAINGRSLEKFINNQENSVYSPYISLRGGFTVLVYTVVDNTMHLLIMFCGWKLFFN